MLSLSGCVFGADLVAIDTLHRQTLVLLFGPELDKGSMDVVEGRCREGGPRGGFGGLLSGLRRRSHRGRVVLRGVMSNGGAVGDGLHGSAMGGQGIAGVDVVG